MQQKTQEGKVINEYLQLLLDGKGEVNSQKLASFNILPQKEGECFG